MAKLSKQDQLRLAEISGLLVAIHYLAEINIAPRANMKNIEDAVKELRRIAEYENTARWDNS